NLVRVRNRDLVAIDHEEFRSHRVWRDCLPGFWCGAPYRLSIRVADRASRQWAVRDSDSDAANCSPTRSVRDLPSPMCAPILRRLRNAEGQLSRSRKALTVSPNIFLNRAIAAV